MERQLPSAYRLKNIKRIDIAAATVEAETGLPSAQRGRNLDEILDQLDLPKIASIWTQVVGCSRTTG